MTPKELGRIRQGDPAGVSFLERTMIHRWNEQAKARKKQEQASKSKRRR